MKSLLFMMLIVMLASGCTVRQTGFTVISTKNVELSRVDLKQHPVVRNQEAWDNRLWFLFIPLGGNPKLEDAVNDCLEKGHGDFMIKPVITSTGWSILLFSYGSWHVKGDIGNSLAGKLPEEEKIIIQPKDETIIIKPEDKKKIIIEE